MVPRGRHHRCARAHTGSEGGGGGELLLRARVMAFPLCASPRALLPDGPYMAAERASVWRSVCVRQREEEEEEEEEEVEEQKLPTRFFLSHVNSSNCWLDFFFFFFLLPERKHSLT